MTTSPEDTEIATLSGDIRLQGEILLGQLDLSFSVGWTCLLGPSGSGKSTLLRLLAGLSCPAWLEGARSVPERIGWMAQSDLLQPRLNLTRNIELMLHLRGETPAPGLARDLLTSVGLAGRETQFPGALSGGQRQRVALARALADDAPLMLLDEPFSALDPITRIAMQDLTYQALKGRNVIMVTHDPAEALRLSDRILIVDRGRIRELETLPGPHPRAVDDPDLARAAGQLLSAFSEALH